MEFIYKILKKARWLTLSKVLKDKGSLLDIGCQDLYFFNKLKNNYSITLADFEPKYGFVKQEDIQNLSFQDHEFDTVLCQEVLEHVPNPPNAIKELKRVCKKKLIITIPNEPFFTLFRGLFWDKEHLWALTPKVLKHHLGKPSFEKKFVFNRYYIGVWEFEEKNI